MKKTRRPFEKSNNHGRFQAKFAGDARGMASFRFEITIREVKKMGAAEQHR
jgi:hypothetical protein